MHYSRTNRDDCYYPCWTVVSRRPKCLNAILAKFGMPRFLVDKKYINFYRIEMAAKKKRLLLVQLLQQANSVWTVTLLDLFIFGFNKCLTKINFLPSLFDLWWPTIIFFYSIRALSEVYLIPRRRKSLYLCHFSCLDLSCRPKIKVNWIFRITLKNEMTQFIFSSLFAYVKLRKNI